MPQKNFMDKLLNDIDRMMRHLEIMEIIEKEGPIGIIKLSEKTKLPPHKVRYSLRVLENNNLVRPSANGAVVTENAKDFMKELRARIEELRRKINAIADNFLPR